MRCRWISGCLAVLVTTFGVAACESEEEPPPATPYMKFAEDYSRVFCDALAPCCALLDFDVESCRLWIGLGFVSEAQAARKDLFVFHQDRATQCIADIEAMGLCSGIEPASCRSVTEGTLPGGSECKSSAECVSSDRSPGSCFPATDGTNRCDYPGRAAAQGETCAGDCDDDYPCVSEVAGMDTFCYPDTGLYCLDDVCTPFDPIGAPCSFDSCVSGATCSGSTCVALAGQGGACTLSTQCSDENYCLNGICTARLPAGSPCTTSESCSDGLCTEGTCFSFLLETMCVFGSI
jgi:hypothetical protein